MRTFLASFVLVAGSMGLTSAIAGCSSDDSAAADKYASTSEFAQAMAEAECTAVARKCGSDVSACLAKRRTFWDARSVESRPRSYTSSRVEACVNAWRAAHEDGELTPAEYDPAIAGSAADICERVFQGSAGKAQACTTDYDCSGDLQCDVIGAATAVPTRLCATPIEKMLGEGCANAGEYCAAGSYCAANGEVRNCIIRRIEAQTCGPNEVCTEDLRCALGLCQKRYVAGGECTSNSDCASSAPLCLEAAGVKKCRPALSFGLDSPVCAPYR